MMTTTLRILQEPTKDDEGWVFVTSEGCMGLDELCAVAGITKDKLQRWGHKDGGYTAPDFFTRKRKGTNVHGRTQGSGQIKPAIKSQEEVHKLLGFYEHCPVNSRVAARMTAAGVLAACQAHQKAGAGEAIGLEFGKRLCPRCPNRGRNKLRWVPDGIEIATLRELQK